MMLCIAGAVLKDKGVNFTFIAQNFKNWTMDELMALGKTTYKVLSLADFLRKIFYYGYFAFE